MLPLNDDEGWLREEAEDDNDMMTSGGSGSSLMGLVLVLVPLLM